MCNTIGFGLAIAFVLLLASGVRLRADTPGATVETPGAAATGLIDLSQPEYTPLDTPAWALVPVPDWVRPFVGRNGAPAPFHGVKKPFGSSVKGLDRYQANNFVNYRPETAEFVYRDYTPLTITYHPGLLPAYERVAATYTVGCRTDTEKAVALLTHAMPKVFRHPLMPPTGVSVRADRGLDDEALLASGCGWCNEQARVFIRLCQVCGIPARMLHLFGQEHTVAEFYADGRWALADSSNFFVVPGQDGKLLSAAQCHDGGAGQRCYGLAQYQRKQELIAMTDEQLFPGHPPAVAQRFREQTRLATPDALMKKVINFGVINVPLPTMPAR